MASSFFITAGSEFLIVFSVSLVSFPLLSLSPLCRVVLFALLVLLEYLLPLRGPFISKTELGRVASVLGLGFLVHPGV